MAKTLHVPPSLEWDTPLYAQATTQLEHALALAEVPDFVAGRLRFPERAVSDLSGGVSVEAEAILAERGIPVLPDVLANAGGVTVSYFEWVQDLGRLFWDRDEIRRRLADKMSDAFDRVWAVAHESGITLRDAALVAALREVSAALEARGIYP